MPLLSTRMSREAGASCKSILYCSPEQPPPTTATRSTPCGRFCFVRSELTFSAALGVTLMSRSSPTRKLGAGVVLLVAEAASIRFAQANPAASGCRGIRDRGKLEGLGYKSGQPVCHDGAFRLAAIESCFTLGHRQPAPGRAHAVKFCWPRSP